MKKAFETYHPTINFGFFCIVICISILVMQPVFLIISSAASLIYALMLEGKGALKFFLCFVLPMIIVVTIVNIFVNPRGMTILFYTKYSYVTLESAVYGFMTGLMLATVLMWFSCYNKIMTSDKFIYIFGRLMPAISLVFSMVMRFVLNYKKQIKKISDAQKCIGRDVANGKLKDRIRYGIKIISIMFTWLLENAIDTADSMRARGYGLKNRSTFSIYRFDKRDRLTLVILILLAGITAGGVFTGKCSVVYYPQIVKPATDEILITVYGAYFILCFFPVFTEIKEGITWKFLKSKI